MSQPEIIIHIGLPSLKFACVQLPYPMTEAEYAQVIHVLAYCKDALIAKGQPKEQPDGKEQE